MKKKRKKISKKRKSKVEQRHKTIDCKKRRYRKIKDRGKGDCKKELCKKNEKE